ncbi:MAG: hypothetical protein WC233_03150 [Sphaerochaeta sp.]|jgi:lipopolysaccharide assembly outer membrane protein LptD (OstA)
MRKVTPKSSRITPLILLLTLVVLTPLIGANEHLLAVRISEARGDELRQMALIRGLDPDLEPSELRNALFAYHSITFIDESPTSDTEQSILVHIAHANRIENPQANLFILEGAVEITFRVSNQEREHSLSGDRLIVDLEHSIITAQGSVRYDDGAAFSQVETEILTYNRGLGQLIMIDSHTTVEHPDKDRKVTLHTLADQLVSISMGAVSVHHKGIIATSAKDPLSSIRAEQLVFKSGGDLFVKSGTLYMGRVPVLWLPFFPFIENRMVGNPAMGFNSERGMFVSTTWEIFGKDPTVGKADRSETLALLAKDEDRPIHHDNLLYRTDLKASALEQWAEESSSYLSIMADAYEHSGLSLGLNTDIRSFKGQLAIQGMGLLAIDPQGVDKKTIFGDVTTLRYLAEPKLSYTSRWANVRLSLPLYSDPSVKRTYANRLTGFSIEGALGKQMEFPTDFTGDITTADWTLVSSFTLPTGWSAPYLSSLSISSLRATAKRRYKLEDGEYGYQITELNIPELQMRASGTLFSFRRNLNKKEEQPSAVKEIELPKDPLLAPIFGQTVAKRSVSSTARQELALSYNLEQRFNQRLDPTEGTMEYRYSFSKATFTFFATPHSNIITVREQLVPQITILDDLSKQTFHSKDAQLFSISDVAIPFLGIEYTLSQRLARTQTNRSASGEVHETDRWAFDKDHVTVHRLKIGRTFKTNTITVQTSATAVLWPLTQSITPLVATTLGPFSLSTSAKFSEIEERLAPDTFNATLGYKDERFTFTVNQSLDLQKVEDEGWGALSIGQVFSFRSAKGQYRFTETLDFTGLTKDGEKNAIERLSLSAEIPHLLLHWVGKGSTAEGVKSQSMKATLSLLDRQVVFYKGRIALSWSIDSSLYFHFEDRYSSRIEVQATLGLWIAEFLDARLSIKSINTGLHRYWQDEHFSLSMMWQDLLSSFDFGGSGRYNTQFNLNSISFDLTHDLGDWSLNCKYNASVVLSNNQYRWVPTVSVYLSWNVLSELNIEEQWTQESHGWVRSETDNR